MSLPQPSLGDTTNSPESIRASVLDICLQLGALDDNSLVAEWMFNDRSIDSVGGSSLCRQNPATRFKEMISSECLVIPDRAITNERPRRRLLPFSIRAPAFTKRLSRSQSQLTTNDGSLVRNGPLRAARLNRISFSRGSFFKRTIDLSERDESTPNIVVSDDGRVSTHPRTFFQRKSIHVSPQPDSLSGSHRETHPVRIDTSSIDTPIHSTFTQPQAPDEPRTRIVQDDDADSEWEEIEAIPDSPLYPLPNDGIDTLAAFPLPTRSQRQSTRTIDSDLDAGIMHHAVRHKFAFALPQGLFRRPSIQRNHSLSLQRRRSSSSLFPISTSEKTLVKSSKSSSTPRKLSRVKITKGKRIRSRSDSLPPSPFVLLTSPRDNDVDPAMPTTQIVSSCETPPRPASGSAIEAQTSCSMGYHHQFFIQAQEEAFRASLK